MRPLISSQTTAQAALLCDVPVDHTPSHAHRLAYPGLMQRGASNAGRVVAGMVVIAWAVLHLGVASATDYNVDYQQSQCTTDFGGVALLLTNPMGGGITPQGTSGLNGTPYYINSPWQAYTHTLGNCSSGTLVNWACNNVGAPCIPQRDAVGNIVQGTIHVGVSVAESDVVASSAFLFNYYTGPDLFCQYTANLPTTNPCAASYVPCDLPAPSTARIAVEPVQYGLLGATNWQVHTDGKTLVIRNGVTFPANSCTGTMCIGNVRFEYYTERQPLSSLNATAVRQPFQVDTVAGGLVACSDSLVIRNDPPIGLARRALVLRPNAIAGPPPGARYVVVNATADPEPNCDSPAATQIWLQEVIVGPNEHLITVIGGSHGTIDPSGPVVVADGADQTFTITPDAGYVVADVRVDGASVGVVTTYTFSHVITNHTIAVSFASTNVGPDCGQAVAVPSELWPPNHGLVPVNVTGVTDPDGDPVTVSVTRVTQDEPPDNHGSDGSCGNAVVDGPGGVRLRAERAGGGNGRVYNVWFTASDGADSCVGSVKVCVPHDRGHLACEDDGLNADVLGDCGTTGQDRAGKRQSLPGAALAGTVVVGSTATLETAGQVRISVYDIAGRRVAVVEDAARSEGVHKATWSTANLARGVYFYRLQEGSMTITKALLIPR